MNARVLENKVMVIIKIYLSRKSWHLVAGYTAARDTNTGTPFVRAINDVFQAHAKSDDIGGLLIRVEIYFLVIGRKNVSFSSTSTRIV